jgi:hypothetical protein
VPTHIDLLPGVSVQWQGRPARLSPFTGSVELVFIAMLFGGFVVWAAWALATHARNQWFALVFCLLPFIMLGLFGRWLSLIRLRYFVTDRRIIIRDANGVHTWWLGSMPPPVITPRASGIGDISFGRSTGVRDRYVGGTQDTPLGTRFGSRGYLSPIDMSTFAGWPLLLRVRDPERVRELIVGRTG